MTKFEIACLVGWAVCLVLDIVFIWMDYKRNRAGEGKENATY